MKKTIDFIKVMQAYLKGEQIQSRVRNLNDEWQDVRPTWNWCVFDYRVKPKKKYVPFDTAEEFLASQQKHGNIANYECVERGLIVFVNNTDVLVIFDQITLRYTMLSYNELFRDYKFSDGTPCGKEVEV